MSTDLSVRKFGTIGDALGYLSEHDLNSVDVHWIYFDPRSNQHVLWHKATVDVTGPVVAHTTVANGKTSGTEIPVYIMVAGYAGVSEEAGPVVASMRLYYRTTGGGPYIGPFGFTRVGDGVFTTSIQAYVVQPPSVDYYIEITDKAGNLTSKGTAAAPLQFTVV